MVWNLLVGFAIVTAGLTSHAVSIRSTESGRVQGFDGAHKTEVYLGIPYAQPPVADLRWKAPVPAESWSGILQAQNFGPTCPQKGNFFANVPSDYFGEPVGSEDCLYLNIWKSKSDRKKPVVVWIHGGSNFKGTSSDPMYDGAFLASRADVVFVSVNYRLGLLGAISLPALRMNGSDLDKSGNFVTLDLIRALQWTRDNIEAFDGDPNNITIMGQSAGCMNVWGLLQSPLAEGLFHRAVCSSGVPNSYPRFVAEHRSHDFLANLVVRAGLAANKDEACEFLESKDDQWIHNFLYQRSTEELVMAQDYIVPFQHISDGVVLPQGLEGVVLGHFNRVPLILGGTIDEGTYLIGMPMMKVSDRELWSIMQDPPADLSSETLLGDTNMTAYKTATKAGSVALWQTLNGIYWGAKAYEPQVYRYAFAWKDLPSPWRDVLGSFHGLDAIFYLGNFVTDQPSFAKFAWTEENRQSREALRARMLKYFSAFFWTGNPNAYMPQKPEDKWDGDILF